MVGPAVRLRVVLVVLGLFAAVCACAGPAPCAGVGVVSGVGLMFPHEGYDNLAGASYELCSRGECVKGKLPREDITKVHLPLPADVDPDTAPVRFRVTRKGAAGPVIDATADVKLARQSDGCGGGGYSRGLAFTTGGGLTPKVPPGLWEAWVKQGEEPATASPATGATAETAESP
jgi:hypothetical protein